MDNLYILLAIIIPIIIFFVQIFYEYKNNQMTYNIIKFPPYKSKCPDYWEVTNENTCKNVNNIGLCKTGGDNIMDFNTHDIFKGKDGDVNKCNWAKNCKTSWDGIDNLC